jgi:uncharacterized protein (TIGR00730 family)
MNRIAVFCGSSMGNEDIYKADAVLLGQTLARENIELIYGGARVGLMGAVADGALDSGGRVTGVLPHFLKTQREVAHDGLSELILVETMHERKKIMHELSDGVIALPGGFGTMEEFFEMLTWAQLGLHQKPMALLNTGGFYDNLVGFMDTMADKGFLNEVNRKMVLVAGSVGGLLDRMKLHKAPAEGKWSTRNQG